MTDKEKAIVMAYTGVTMLKDDKFQIFHKYVEDIMGRPIWTHEMVQFADEIKEKSKADFMALCADEGSSENPYKWMPVSERLPDTDDEVLCWYEYYHWNKGKVLPEYGIGRYLKGPSSWFGEVASGKDVRVIAWQPLPKPYRAESEDKK